MTGAAFIKLGLAPTTHITFIHSSSLTSFFPSDCFSFQELNGTHDRGIVEQAEGKRRTSDSFAHPDFTEPPSGQGHRIPRQLQHHKAGIPAAQVSEIGYK